MILTQLILEEWSGYWTVKQVALDSLERLKDENQVISKCQFEAFKFNARPTVSGSPLALDYRLWFGLVKFENDKPLGYL